MSQYPSPYQPPPPPGQGGYYAAPYPTGPDPLTPARRASIMMFVLGGLLLSCGGISLLFSALPFDKLAADQPQLLELSAEFTRTTGMSVQTLFLFAGLVLALPGLLYLVFGFLVRGGGVVPAVLGIVVASIHGVVQLLGVVRELAGGHFNLVSLLIPALVLSGVAFIIINLVRAIRNAPQVLMMKQGYGQPSFQQQPPYPYGNYPPPPPPGQT